MPSFAFNTWLYVSPAFQMGVFADGGKIDPTAERLSYTLAISTVTTAGILGYFLKV